MVLDAQDYVLNPMVNGKTQVDMHSFDIARLYPEQKEKEFVKSRAFENSQTIYTPAVHPREPYISERESL